MVSEFQKYYSYERKLVATSMVLTYNSGQSKVLVCLIAYKGFKIMGFWLPRVVLNFSNISQR